MTEKVCQDCYALMMQAVSFIDAFFGMSSDNTLNTLQNTNLTKKKEL